MPVRRSHHYRAGLAEKSDVAVRHWCESKTRFSPRFEGCFIFQQKLYRECSVERSQCVASTQHEQDCENHCGIDSMGVSLVTVIALSRHITAATLVPAIQSRHFGEALCM